MKAKTWILEVLVGNKTEVFILRDGKGIVKKATNYVDEFIDYLRNSDEIEQAEAKAAEELEKELEDDK